MDGPGQHFLSDPAFAVNGDSGAGRGRHLLRRLQDDPHRGRTAADVLKAELFLLGLQHPCVAGPYPGVFQQSGHHDQQLVAIERLEQVVVGPFFHGRHGVLHAAVSGDQDEGQLRPLAMDPPQQLYAVCVRHDQIGNHQVNRGSGPIPAGPHRRILRLRPGNRHRQGIP